MGPELLFLLACLIFCGLLMAWLSMLGRLGMRAIVGFFGALVSALVMGVFWQAEHLEWVGVYLKPTLGVWVMAGVLCGLAVVSGLGREKGVRVLAGVLGVIGLMTHSVALVTFMWMATMAV